MHGAKLKSIINYFPGLFKGKHKMLIAALKTITKHSRRTVQAHFQQKSNPLVICDI
jgi:hypothetical protein